MAEISSIGYRPQRLIPTKQSIRLAVLLSVVLHTITMATAQNVAVSSTVPTLVHGGALVAAANLPTNCSNVKSLFEAQGINSLDIPTQPMNDVRLAFCDISASETCCTNSMEKKLASNARTELERNTKDLIGKLASVLSSRAIRFDEFFKNLLSDSKTQFHEMFKRTYGVIYEQNSYVFSELFTDLENYYIRGKVDLSEELDKFFNVLYQKMFTVLNSQYKFDDNYLGCVSEHMKQLKPFGDIPEKLTTQIKRSFVATRSLEQALASAADVAKNMANIHSGGDCSAALTKMRQCGACKGFVEKPCSNYCVNVMSGCLSHYRAFDLEWDNFVQAMDRIIERLLGPFNIVMVVEPINIKISEAIMNFQETGTDVSQQIFNGCGRPQLNPKRRRRAVSPKLLISEKRYFDDIGANSRSDSLDNFSFDDDVPSQHAFVKRSQGSDRYKRDTNTDHANSMPNANHEVYFDQVQFDAASDEDNHSPNKQRRKNKNNNRNNGGMNTARVRNEDNDDHQEPALDRLIRDIRAKVRDSKKFWSNLPYQICNNEEIAASPSNDVNCWNGNKIDRYPHMITNDPVKNSEFPQQSSAVFVLRSTIEQLQKAYNGHDVEWTDTEEPYYGSGSGSGDGPDEDIEEGSGMPPIDLTPETKEKGGSSTTHTITTGDTGYTGIGSTSTKSDTDIKTHTVDSDSNNVNKINSNNSNNNNNKSSGAIGTSTQEMSLRRALLTYFLPIYIAWFGGFFSELL